MLPFSQDLLYSDTHVQANYINALAASVLRLFEPAGPMTLGQLFLTLGELLFTFHSTIFNVMFRSV
jgi:hypothetical protein